MTDESTHGVRAGSRILLVDDYADSAETVSKLLELLGHEVQATGHGTQARATDVAWCREFVLEDIGLPALDGYEVVRRIRQEVVCQDTTIIAVTGERQSDDRRRSWGSGIDHHRVKPVNSGTLWSLLSRATIGPARASFDRG